MKIKFTLFIFLVLSINIFAQTQVSGNQSGTWAVANSPYQVVGELIILSGEALSIEPGVEVNFQGYYKFTVEGNLQALGTETDTIFFTTDDQTTGWGGIRFNESDGISELSYCRIEYGKTSGEYPDIHGGGMALLTSDAIILNCVFADNDATGEENGMGGAVYAINTGSPSATLTRFTDCKFIRNHAYGEGGAIKFSGDMNTEVMNCEFIENNCNYGGGAISLYSVFGTKMIYCLFADNFTMYSGGGAIHTLGFGNELAFENCTLSGNTAVSGDGGAMSLDYASATLVNCIVYDNQGMYSDDIYLGFASSAEINYCNLTMPDGATGSNNINEDPLFVNVNDQNFQLQETSPCIDAGLDIGYEFIGDAPDMGCFEYGLPTNITNNETQELLIYPNPVSDYLTVRNVKNIEILNILDISGRTIFTKQLSGKENIIIDVSKFRTGTYFMVAEADNEVFTTQVVKR